MLQRAVDEQGLPEDEFRKLYKAMLAYYAENNAVHTQPLPACARSARSMLRERDCDGGGDQQVRGFARQILTSLDLADHFVAIIGGDTMGKGKAKPAPDPVFEAVKRGGGGSLAFVGDSSYDVMPRRAPPGSP